jgi:hypothetical protein
MTRTLRAAALNLGKKPLIEAAKEDIVQRIILTPEGDEIAPPREVLEPGEATPIHDKYCPCQRCAEKYHGAQPEQHHQDCQCGLCEDADQTTISEQEEASEQRSAFSDQHPTNDLSSRAKSAQADAAEEPALSLSKGPAFPQPATIEGAPSFAPAVGAKGGPVECLQPITEPPVPKKTVPATKLYEETKTEQKQASFFDYLYGDPIRKHEAQYAERVRAAREAGLEPPPYEPFDIAMMETEADRQEQAEKEEIEKNKQVAREIWIRRFGTPPPEPELTWNEKEDLRVAAMKASQSSQQPIANSH